jgi:hypothetical protein
MSQADVFAALATRTEATAGTTTAQFAWPNVDFVPPASGPYFRIQSFPTEAVQASLGDGGQNRFRGLWQIDVFAPEGEGLTDGLVLAQAFATQFKRGLALTTTGGLTVRVVKPPVIGPAIIDPPFVQIPVTVEYQFDAANP